MDLVPDIKGIKKESLMQLYVAKCFDLKINASKAQMVRFFEIIKNNQSGSSRKLNLSDCGFGDSCLLVLSKILKRNTNFSQVDLSKNDFSNEGLRALADSLRDFNSTIVHLNIGGNHIGPEGTMYLFQAL